MGFSLGRMRAPQGPSSLITHPYLLHGSGPWGDGSAHGGVWKIMVWVWWLFSFGNWDCELNAIEINWSERYYIYTHWRWGRGTYSVFEGIQKTDQHLIYRAHGILFTLAFNTLRLTECQKFFFFCIHIIRLTWDVGDLNVERPYENVIRKECVFFFFRRD